MPKGNRTNHPKHDGQFKSDDPRRNNNGQRKAEVVATAAQYRDYLIEMLHRPLTAPAPENITYLALMAHNHVKAAAAGDASERESLLDRIWGRQPTSVNNVNVEVSQNHANISAEELRKLPPDELVKLYRESLGKVADVKRRW